MRNDSFIFQRKMPKEMQNNTRRQNNAPIPGIRIPMRAVQKRSMKEGYISILYKVHNYPKLIREKNSYCKYFHYQLGIKVTE